MQKVISFCIREFNVFFLFGNYIIIEIVVTLLLYQRRIIEH